MASKELTTQPWAYEDAAGTEGTQLLDPAARCQSTVTNVAAHSRALQKNRLAN